MTVQKTTETARATTTFAVDGPESQTPVLFVGDYTFKGQKIFPTRAVADWSRRDGRWLLLSVRVWGDVQTRSGARGKVQTERMAFERRAFRSEKETWTVDTPDWLASAVLGNEPA